MVMFLLLFRGDDEEVGDQDCDSILRDFQHKLVCSFMERTRNLKAII